MKGPYCFYLSSCSTCIRILKEVHAEQHGVVLQDLKASNVSADQLDEMAAQTGSYEALFSRRSMKYRGLGLHEKQLTEADYRTYILQEYTFLKRPVFWIEGELFVGNTKKVVQAVGEKLG